MDEQQSDLDEAIDTPDEGEMEQPERLDLRVQIDERNACQRHITVTISREDIDRYISEAFSEMMPTAQVPGFRAGRAPRKLVESRYRKDIAQQVKGSLLMDSVTQVTEDYQLAAISEPDLDPSVIEVPEDGPMTFEFDLEVRPDFEMPEWRGLNIKQAAIDTSDEAVDKKLAELLREHARGCPRTARRNPATSLRPT